MLSTKVGAALKRVVGFTLITVIAFPILKRFVNTVHALATPAITSTSQGPKPALEILPKLSGVSATYQNGFGIIADIRNTSSVPVWLRPTWVTLTPPPELQPNQTDFSWFAVINGRPTSQPESDKFNRYQQVVMLGAGETVPAVWTPIENPCMYAPFLLKWLACEWKQLSQALNFTPGDYKMKIVANFWGSKEGATAESDDYQTQTSEIKVTVTATQWIIMFGAFWGAIGAYLVVPNVREIKIPEGKSYWFSGFSQDAVGIISSSLFAIIVTILLARLSDTQFLLKVTVSDFWGAIAIGFLATATRKTILKKIAPAAT